MAGIAENKPLLPSGSDPSKAKSDPPFKIERVGHPRGFLGCATRCQRPEPGHPADLLLRRPAILRSDQSYFVVVPKKRKGSLSGAAGSSVIKATMLLGSKIMRAFPLRITFAWMN
jgi:hypothetical protein